MPNNRPKQNRLILNGPIIQNNNSNNRNNPTEPTILTGPNNSTGPKNLTIRNKFIPLTYRLITTKNINLFSHYKFLEFSIQKIEEALNVEYNSNNIKIIKDTYFTIKNNTYIMIKDNTYYKNDFNNNLTKILINISPELYGCFIYLIYYKESYINRANTRESNILKELINLGKNIDLVQITYNSAPIQGLKRTNTPLPFYGSATSNFAKAVTNKFKFIQNFYPVHNMLDTGNANIKYPYNDAKLIKVLTKISPELYGKIIYTNLYVKSIRGVEYTIIV